MTAEEILMDVDSTLKKRESAAELLASSSNLRIQTIKIIEDNSDLSLKALLVFEILGRKSFPLIEEYIFQLVQAAKFYKDSSSKRCLAKIFNFAIIQHKDQFSDFKLNSQLRSEIIEFSFQWLIRKEKTAVKVFSMQNIFELKNEQDWISDELKAILKKDLPDSSAGYRSRGVKILRKLEQ